MASMEDEPKMVEISKPEPTEKELFEMALSFNLSRKNRNKGMYSSMDAREKLYGGKKSYMSNFK
jgi:hypothetical protein